MRVLQDCRVPLRSPSGDLVAHIVLTPCREADHPELAPLTELEDLHARDYGETTTQLREAERYEYEVVSTDNVNLRLRCSRSARRRNLRAGALDAGVLETRSFCGTLLLELVNGEVDAAKPAVASAVLDVRSVKLDYRTEYRGMLRRLSARLSDLVVDARESTKAAFRSSFEERTEVGWLQIQLELLREVLDSSEFSAAITRILSFPHERLTTECDRVPTDRPVRWAPSAVRQLVLGNPRRTVPASHPVCMKVRLQSIADHVSVPRNKRDFDTPENRFIKHTLQEFRAFLAHAHDVFQASSGWGASAALAHRLAEAIGDWLGRGLFREIGALQIAPLGSPVLQRRAGYREVHRWWLRFRTAAELSWKGGEDVFRAGQRDVASLYEYWLFFELLEWFCRKCRDGRPPPVHELLDGLETTSPNLRLRTGEQLGPISGMFVQQGRRLSARFCYNKVFKATSDRHQSGSWTRRLHPDYTLTFWPEALSEAEAERLELLVHLHFDAKYRVENLEGLFGTEEGADVDDDVGGSYKRQDLLKMHAYRDAIKRSQGAYVLYPGRPRVAGHFRGFHEILPGLGAFGIAPDSDGEPKGLGPLEEFLDAAMTHLCNRTTAQERVSYHLSDAYATSEQVVPYGALRLRETDPFAADFRAVPPAEHMVLLAWFRNDAQLDLARATDGLVFVRLGRRSGSFHVHPNVARVRHLVLKTAGGVVAPGLCMLTEPGFRVYTRSELRDELKVRRGSTGVAVWERTAAKDDDEYIYALFRTTADPIYAAQRWDGDKLMDLVEVFEADARNRPVANLGRTSPYPRIISLRDLLKTRLST